MTIKYWVSAAAFIGISAAGVSVVSAIATAQEQPHANVAIAISALDGEQVMDFTMSGDGNGFDLHDMQEGENRSIVDDSGRSILVTREADGFRFDVDGKSVKMPAFDGGPHGAVFIGDAASENVAVHVMGGVASGVSSSTLSAHPVPGTMIMTEKPIDDATRLAIESLLQSAGHDAEVRFMDREAMHGSISGYNVIHQQVELGQ